MMLRVSTGNLGLGFIKKKKRNNTRNSNEYTPRIVGDGVK